VPDVVLEIGLRHAPESKAFVKALQVHLRGDADLAAPAFLLDQPQALYHGTRFADGKTLLAPAWKDPCVCGVWCTEEALFIRREGLAALLAIAHAEVSEAALHRGYAPIAEKELPMLRLRWRRGGESLETKLSLRGGMASLEALRREIHLRQANVAEQLAPLLQRPPP